MIQPYGIICPNCDHHLPMSREAVQGLTRAQKVVLDYLAQCAVRGDVTPTYKVMAAALSRNSKSSIHRLITCLAERGFLDRTNGKHQSLTLSEKAWSMYAARPEGAPHA